MRVKTYPKHMQPHAYYILRNMKTHQSKRRQPCRENRAIKTGDWVVALRMKRTRQLQRRNKNNHATSTPHAPCTAQTHTAKQSLQ